MKKKAFRIFWAWDFDKEERWLNQMSQAGWQLYAVGICTYYFEQGAPGEYIYKLELLDNLPSAAESVNYIHFVEETGAEHVGSVLRWVYFRKKADGAGFDMYSDLDSRIRHLNRILLLMGAAVLMLLPNGANMFRFWVQGGATAFLVIAIIMVGVGLLACGGSVRLWLKRRRLKKEKLLRE